MMARDAYPYFWHFFYLSVMLFRFPPAAAGGNFLPAEVNIIISYIFYLKFCLFLIVLPVIIKYYQISSGVSDEKKRDD